MCPGEFRAGSQLPVGCIDLEPAISGYSHSGFAIGACTRANSCSSGMAVTGGAVEAKRLNPVTAGPMLGGEGEKTLRIPFGSQEGLFSVWELGRNLAARSDSRPASRRKGRTAKALLRRRWDEPFALAAGLRLGLWLRGFLGFLFAFVFASHGCKCDTTGGCWKRQNRCHRLNGMVYCPYFVNPMQEEEEEFECQASPTPIALHRARVSALSWPCWG